MSIDLSALAALVEQAGWSALLPDRSDYGSVVSQGDPVLYDALPLGDDRWVAVVGGAAEPVVVPLVVRAGTARRAVGGDGVTAAVLAALPALAARPAGHFIGHWWATSSPNGDVERSVTVDQTNESMIVSEQTIGKWLLMAPPGPHPSMTILEELQRDGFMGTPRPWGALEWQPEGEQAPRLLISFVSYLPNVADGWTWAWDLLRDAATNGDDDLFLSPARHVGELVADFHLAMRSTARRSTPQDSERWQTEALADLDQALALTSGHARHLLEQAAPLIRSSWAALEDRPRTVLRCHGDLHAGQVLHRADEPEQFWLVDFDGNPVIPAAERGRRQPPALDIAGIAQSLSHVPWVLLRHEPETDRGAVTRLGHAAVGTFLEAYRQRVRSHSADDLLDDDLVPAFRLRQVCREFSYAAAHLPRWSYVPEAALPALMEEMG